ncbi:MAG: 23S rRNA (adenine(2030)-N(6))-methyltransferase RlmJ [Alphaproteobacteria bacterium]|nr:23S rRNA (adenine(2030)-N(6))-methyltransferase RlmJ [Alphaproteobacteria bacterium]
MLSYQHGFHAGNFADILKHATLLELLDHLGSKDKPFCVLDSHAGRGVYDLSAHEAEKTGEWRAGIGRLLEARPKGRALARLCAAVQSAGPARYPGSPALVLSVLRPEDRWVGLELHPTEHAELSRWIGRDRRVAVHKRDALEGLPALVPPLIRRGLVLIDPSYEVKTDYAKLPEMIIRCVRRWANGIYALWYPILIGHDPQTAMIKRLAERLGSSHGVLVVEVSGREIDRGMSGCGLVLINPPFQIETSMAEICAEMVDLHLAGLTRWRVERVAGAYAGKRLRQGGAEPNRTDT